MIFDQIWRAERAEKSETRIRNFYHPKLEAAKKANDEKEYQSLLASMYFEHDINEHAEVLRTVQLERRARRLGIEIPPKPGPNVDDNAKWFYNNVTGEFTFAPKGELEITREIRKEEIERLQFKMRWVSQIVIPITGLIGTIIGLISVLRVHK
jgi:hypothetical protein